MGRLFGILIWTLLFVFMKGQMLFDDLGDKYKSIDLTLHLIKIELQQFSQGMESMVTKKLDGIENSIEVRIGSMMQTQHRLLKKDVSSLTTSLSGKVDEKISNVLSTTQIEQQLLRQEMVSLITNMSGNVDEKISDLITVAQTDQPLLRQEMMSLTTNLSRRVDEKIIDLITIAQTEQELLTQEVVSITTNLSEKVDEKTSDIITISQTEQRLLTQEMVSLATNLSGEVDEKIGDLITISKSEQRLLTQEIMSLTTNLSEKVDEKIGDLVTVAQTNQPLLTQLMVSLMANLTGKVNEKITDLITINLTEQQLLRQEIVSLTTKVDTLLNNSEINWLKARENVINDIRNSSLYVSEQISSGEVIHILRYLEMTSQLNSIAVSDCYDILEKYPSLKGINGVYKIMDSNKAKTVYCDMTTDNGGWTVIERRSDGSVDFYRNWMEYKNGFGYADNEYWIGNDMLHRLTSLRPQELRVDMERFEGEKAYALYSSFSVGDEANKYKLMVQGYSGDAGDSLDYHNNMTFTTRDQDNDRWSNGNCAIHWRSAGWFNICLKANHNGEYIDSEIANDPKYIVWYHWENSWVSLKSMKLMIRPLA